MTTVKLPSVPACGCLLITGPFHTRSDEMRCGPDGRMLSGSSSSPLTPLPGFLPETFRDCWRLERAAANGRPPVAATASREAMNRRWLRTWITGEPRPRGLFRGCVQDRVQGEAT